MEIFIRGLVALGIALAVAAYGFSDTVPAPAGVAAPAAAGHADNGCGWSPRIKHLFAHAPHLGGDGCGKHGLGHGGLGLGAGAGSADPGHGIARTQPGTVVFPQHPFVRSPRDFFMMD
jgi:hypothetical protein